MTSFEEKIKAQSNSWQEMFNDNKMACIKFPNCSNCEEKCAKDEYVSVDVVLKAYAEEKEIIKNIIELVKRDAVFGVSQARMNDAFFIIKGMLKEIEEVLKEEEEVV